MACGPSSWEWDFPPQTDHWWDELDDRCSNLRNVGGRKDVNCFLAEQLNFGAEVFLHGAHADHISLDIFLGLDGAPSCRSFGP